MVEGALLHIEQAPAFVEKTELEAASMVVSALTEIKAEVMVEAAIGEMCKNV